MIEAESVVSFWLVETPPEKRFKRDDAVDAEMRRRFGALHARLAEHVPDDWRVDGRSILAAIIVLDQFSRNLFRDDARAFATDAAALTLAREAVDRGLDSDLNADERQFLYMPFMHSEVLADTDRSIALMLSTGDEDAIAYARRHRDTIARLGRYPGRNAALNRASTSEEQAFLAGHPEGF